MRELGKFHVYWQGEDICEWCSSIGKGSPWHDMCVTPDGYRSVPSRKKLGACFVCSRQSKGCSRGKLFCHEVSDTGKRVWLEDNGMGGAVAYVGEGPPGDGSRKLTPQQLRDLESAVLPESTGSSSMANDNVKNKIQDKTVEIASRLQAHVREVEALVRDRERESGDVSDMEDDGDDSGEIEIGIRGDKIQDKEYLEVPGRRPTLRFKATPAARPAAGQNKIQDKNPEKEKEKRERADAKRNLRVGNDALVASLAELEVVSSDEDEDDEDDDEGESGVDPDIDALVADGMAKMQEFVRGYKERFPGAPTPVLLPSPGSGLAPIAGLEGGVAYMARLKASGVGSRSAVHKRMWMAKRTEFNEAMLAYGKAMAEYVRLQGELVALEETWKWWKKVEDGLAGAEGELTREEE